MSLHTWPHQGPCDPSSCATFTLSPHWGRASTGKKSLVSMHAGSLWLYPTLCNPFNYGLPGFSVRGFSRQEYWRVLANSDCHILLEHYISCCHSWQLLWVPDAARATLTQATAPPPHLAFTGADQVLQGSLRNKSRGWITCRGGNKTTVETQEQSV